MVQLLFNDQRQLAWVREDVEVGQHRGRAIVHSADRKLGGCAEHGSHHDPPFPRQHQDYRSGNAHLGLVDQQAKRHPGELRSAAEQRDQCPHLQRRGQARGLTMSNQVETGRRTDR